MISSLSTSPTVTWWATGVYNAIAKAVHAVDNCVKDVIEAAKANDYEAIIIADHGNADNAINEDGTPNTAHSLNPVPFIYVTDNNSATVKDGRLADVAPSILHILGLEQPGDMTGENLISDNRVNDFGRKVYIRKTDVAFALHPFFVFNFELFTMITRK